MEFDTAAMNRLISLRKELFDAIDRCLAADGHHKSYEGAISVCLPNRFEDESRWSIVLHCYLIGPGRHHEWSGESLADVVARAEKDVRKWIKESDDIIKDNASSEDSHAQ